MKALEGYQDDQGTGASLLWEKAERAGSAQPREVRVQWRLCVNIKRERMKVKKPDSSQQCPLKGQEGNEHNENTRYSMWTQENIYFCVVFFLTVRLVKYWNKLSKEVSEFPFMGTTQNLTGHSPRQQAPGDSAQIQKVRLHISRLHRRNFKT